MTFTKRLDYQGIHFKADAQQCEWNPDEGRPGLQGEHQVPADYLCGSAGNTTWYLCASCADIKQFRRLKRKPLPEAAKRMLEGGGSE